MTRETIDRLADREALRELRARYTHCYDSGDLEGFLDLFTEDGLLQLAQTGFARGRDELRRALAGPMQAMEFAIHFTSDELTEFAGPTSARARSRFAVHTGRKPNIQGAGTYLDEYQLTERGWKFRARRIEFFYMGERGEWPATPPKPPDPR
jgi:ketosteroid isomerase-like protein